MLQVAMDHLLLPRNPISEPMKVPILSLENYDHGDFNTYPERQGWGTRTVAEWKLIFQTPPPELAAFLQRWLYFGLLEFISNTKIDIASSFVSQDHNQDYPILTTEKLPIFISKFSGRHFESKVIAFSTACMVHGALDLSASKRAENGPNDQETLIQFIMAENPTDPRDARVVLAEILLIELIAGGLSPTEGIAPVQHGNRSLVWQLMTESGWCPAQLLPMFSEFTTSGLLFLHKLERPSPWEKHQTIQPRENIMQPVTQVDSGCKPHRCRFQQLSDDIYETKHTECSGCTEVVAHVDTLCNILLRRKIPLIVCIDSRDRTDISLVEAEPGITAYVAISHVWSDGLGNVQRNALNRCQLLRLNNLVRSLPGSYGNIVHFWIDTICVPPDAACQEKAQAIALQMMRRTYEDATVVLVLDSWLFGFTTHGTSDTEILVRIFSCLWNRRLWTYQEGALARKLLFQFKDCAYELESGMDRLNNSKDAHVDMTLMQSLNSKNRSLRSFTGLGRSVEDKLDAIINAMQFRTTSVKADEALCLAALLNFDMTPILNTKPYLRMREFWRMTTSVPAGILLYKGRTFDKTPGLRWAPRTLLLSPSNIIESVGVNMGVRGFRATGSLLAQVTSRGLLVRAKGIVFVADRSGRDTKLTMKDEKGKFHQITIDWTESRHPYSSRKVLIKLAFIYLERPKVGGAASPDISGKIARPRPGILVAIREESDGIIYTRKIGCIAWVLQLYISPYRVTVDDTVPFCSGKTMPIEQQWCVD
ncbi:hypothetical protein V492_01942 [Pseudogymnoascus sp. VKM F-4246]|nr:hypothetical protein V492_01942 [Pseudogymnoascus sp. VKM F-4246]